MFFVVLSASVAQVRAHAQRKMLRAESRMQGLQSRLIWRLWRSLRELQYLESLLIQLMVQYGMASFLSDSFFKVLHFPPGLRLKYNLAARPHSLRHIHGGRCRRSHRLWDISVETLHPHWPILGENCSFI